MTRELDVIKNALSDCSVVLGMSDVWELKPVIPIITLLAP